MNALRVNPKTGFLESPSQNNRAFGSHEKLKVLDLIAKHIADGRWPRVTDICSQIGIAAMTLYRHLDADQEFREQYDEAMLAAEDQLAGNLYEQGKAANGITANIFLLKTRWPQRWGERNQIVVVDLLGVKDINNGNPTVIEADIVETPAIIGTQTLNNEPKRLT